VQLNQPSRESDTNMPHWSSRCSQSVLDRMGQHAQEPEPRLETVTSYRNPMVKHEPELHKNGAITFAAKLLPRMIKTLSSLHRKGL
jgi:hypothetical protein